jgi:hypothetical protein
MESATVSDTAAILGVPWRTLIDWVNDGTIRTTLPENRDRGQRISPVGVLAAGLLNFARKRSDLGPRLHAKVRREIGRKVAMFVQTLAPSDIEMALADGRTWIVATNHQSTPQLCMPGVLANKSGVAIVLFAADLSVLWPRVKAAFRRLEMLNQNEPEAVPAI